MNLTTCTNALSVFFVFVSVSCAHKDLASTDPLRQQFIPDTVPHKDLAATDPLRQQFIPDTVPLRPKNSKSIRSYALTLPIFEMTDQAQRVEWVKDSEPRRESRNKLVLVGQGAQCNIAIERVSQLETSEQIIRLVLSSELELGPDNVYDLVRVEGGWKCVEFQKEQGLWDQMFEED